MIEKLRMLYAPLPQNWRRYSVYKYVSLSQYKYIRAMLGCLCTSALARVNLKVPVRVSTFQISIYAFQNTQAASAPRFSFPDCTLVGAEFEPLLRRSTIFVGTSSVLLTLISGFLSHHSLISCDSTWTRTC
jgi:hypothetical protein